MNNNKIEEVIVVKDNFIHEGEVVSVNSTGITPNKSWEIVIQSSIDGSFKKFLIPLAKINCGNVRPYCLKGEKVKIQKGELILVK